MAKRKEEDEEQFSLRPARNIYTLEHLASDLILVRSLQQEAKETGKLPYVRSGIYQDLRKLRDGTHHYKNGKICAVEGCKFKDVVFHHLDYENNLGIYLCWLHHSMQHVDKIEFGGFILMMAERGLTAFSIELGEDSVKIRMKPKGLTLFPIFAIRMRENV